MARKMVFLGAIISVIIALFIFRPTTGKNVKKTASTVTKKKAEKEKISSETFTEIAEESPSKNTEETKDEQDYRRTVIVSGSVIDAEGNPITNKTVSYQIMLGSRSILDEFTGLNPDTDAEQLDPETQISRFITSLLGRNQKIDEDEIKRMTEQFLKKRSGLPDEDTARLEQLFSDGTFLQALDDLKKLNNTVTTDQNGYFEFETTYKADPRQIDKLILSMGHPKIEANEWQGQTQPATGRPGIQKIDPSGRLNTRTKVRKPIGISTADSSRNHRGGIQKPNANNHGNKTLTTKSDTYSKKFDIDEQKEIISDVIFIVDPVSMLTVNIEPFNDLAKGARVSISFDGYNPIFRHLRGNNDSIQIPLLANMPFTLSCFAAGFLDYKEQYPPMPIGNHEITVTLSKGNIPFTGVITDDRGAPIENAHINISQEGLQLSSVTTDSTGKFSMYVAAPSVDRVTIYASGYRGLTLTNVDATKLFTVNLESAPNSQRSVSSKLRKGGLQRK